MTKQKEAKLLWKVQGGKKKMGGERENGEIEK